MQNDKSREHIRDIRGNGDSRNAHAEHDDEKEIEHDICCAGKSQHKEWVPAVPAGAKDCRAEIVKQKKRVAEHIDAQIQRGVPQDILRGLYQPQKRLGSKLPRDHSGYADYNCHHDRRSDGERYLFPAALTDQPRNKYIRTDRQPRGHRDYQRDDLGIVAHRRERVLVSEITDYRRVGGIEQLLKNTAQRNGKRKQQYFLCKRTVKHVRIRSFEIHVSDPPIGY